MPQEDEDAAELHEGKEVVGVVFVAGDQAAEVLEPGMQPLDEPAAPVAAQGPAILGAGAPVAAMRGDQRDATFRVEARIQAVTVVRPIADQSRGELGGEALVERRFDQRDFVGRSARDADGERKTSAVCHCHDLGPLAPFGLADTGAPFFAPAKVPSIKPSLRSRPPRSAKSAASARSIRSHVPARTHC